MADVALALPIDRAVRIEVGSEIVIAVRYRKVDGTFLVTAEVPEGMKVIVRDAATVTNQGKSSLLSQQVSGSSNGKRG